MTLVSNVYLTHGLMLVCAVAAACNALPESTGRIVPEWRPAMTALLAALSALALVAYPTWGELKNPGLWMFAILAAVAGLARGYWLRIDVDHSWRLIRLRKAYDCLIATVALIALALTVIASFLVGRLAAVQLRSRQEPQSDLHDSPSPPAEG